MSNLELRLMTVGNRPFQEPPDVLFERHTFERRRVTLLGQAWQWPDGFYPFKLRAEDDGSTSIGFRAFDRDGHEFTAHVSERLLLKAASFLAEYKKSEALRKASDE
jgi:hypothetical protein